MLSSGNISSCIEHTTFVYLMQKPAVEYRKIQKHSSGDTLLVTIPYDFAKAIPLNYLPQRIGPGALQNEQVRRCYKCKEPIAFKKRQDGGWQLIDYFTGQQHEHRREEIDRLS